MMRTEKNTILTETVCVCVRERVFTPSMMQCCVCVPVDAYFVLCYRCVMLPFLVIDVHASVMRCVCV